MASAMRVGLMTYPWQDMESLHYMSRLTELVLRDRHEVRYCPPQYLHVPRAERLAMVRDWVASCDVLAVPIDEVVFGARSELGAAGPPAVVFAMGVPSRGGRALEGAGRLLRTSDLLVGSCTAEVEQCRAFLPGAALRMLPFPVDERRFYPEDPGAIAALRRRLGIDAGARVIVYAGRISLDKNLHTLLKAFSVVQRRLPEAVLVIAGTETNWAFGEFGVFAVDVTRMLRKRVGSLGIDPRRVRFIGHRGPDELRALYGAADVVFNLTLTHNENFGVAQVEAMLCGTRVVGTDWGGLRDTIIEGLTGRKVAATLTGSGIKVNWWEAACAVVEELAFAGDRAARRRACRAAALERYSLERYRESLEALISECAAGAGRPGDPLEPSAFASRLWALFRNGDGLPPYRRGPEAFDLYRELVRPFLGARGAPAADLTGPAIVCLASPVARRATACLAINDPLFPMEVQVPDDLQDAVEAIVSLLERESVARAGSLLAVVPGAGRALAWMADVGLVLATTAGDGGSAEGFEPIPDEAAFNIVPVDRDVDVFYVR